MAGFKRANKKATKGVRRVWRKGQSSSFNPTFNKFRMEAKKRGVFGNQGFSNLTEARLAEHNKKSYDKQCEDVDESMSIGGETGISAMSAFTNCSLPTFSRLISNWNSSSLIHKQMMAILSAITAIVQEKGGKETDTEYFAALMTTLDTVDSDEEIIAVISLLSLSVRRLNESVLKHEFETTLEKIIKLLLKYMNSDHGALLINLMKVAYTFLRVKVNLSDSDCEKFKILLEFTVHHKPKVRRAAHQMIRSLIVDGSRTSVVVHPGCAVVTEFCIARLNKSGGPTPPKDVFYVLSLLEEVLGVFPKSSVKSISETIIHVMTLSNSMVTSACLKTLRGLFHMEPKPDTLPADLNAKLITALYDYQPNIKEVNPLISWLLLKESAFINLKRLDEKLCVTHLPRFFEKAVKCWQNDSEQVLETVTSVLKNLLHECIRPSGEVFQQFLLEDPVKNPMYQMFHPVEKSLTYQYHKAWKYVLTVLAAFFEVMGKYCYPQMKKCLTSLADLHDTYKFAHTGELEKAIGMAIQHMGPRVVLDAIPLQWNESSDRPDFPRSWLLPLLRDYIKKTDLKFFIEEFYPLTSRLRNKVTALEQEQKIVESKLYDLLCSQIWSLLPGFCNEPTDLKESFKDIAQTLGKLMEQEPSNRMTILSSLRLLISKNLENEENRMELARFSKKYLPIFFNLYLKQTKDKDEERVRLAVYETSKAFLQLLEKELCNVFFNKALDKLKELDEEQPKLKERIEALNKLMKTETDNYVEEEKKELQKELKELVNKVTENTFQRQCLIDISRAILPYVDVDHIKKIYEYCKPLLTDSNHTLQKKAYSVLNAICSSESKSCKSFVKKHLEDIRPLLCGNASGLTPATKALRLNILGHIIKQLPSSEKEFVKTVVPEAVLGTKENSVKARAAAYNLLLVIGNTLLEWNPKDETRAIQEYVDVLNSGLLGSPHLVSASVLAIGRVLFQFKDKMDSRLIGLLIENACLLLTSKSREVVVSAISFIKILLSVMDNADLAEYVELMVKSITSISKDNQRPFRFKAKEIITRLIRKFGHEMISKLVPEDYQKQISHIRKMEARKARKKKVDDDDDDDEDEDSKPSNKNKTSEGFDAILADSDEEMPLETDTEKPTKQSRKKRRTVETVIEEHGEDDIVDLLDPSINKRLLTKMPEKAVIKKTEKGFPVSDDGRLIITEEEDAAPKSKDKEMDERREILAELGAFKRKKRKYQEVEEDFDEDEAAVNKPVTKGIYRTLEPKTKKTPGAEFRAKKAGGDIKKGKYDPFAYIPLNKQMLNKRKQVKVKGQFKNLVKGAKKGASTGAKRKMRQARRKKNKN